MIQFGDLPSLVALTLLHFVHPLVGWTYADEHIYFRICSVGELGAIPYDERDLLRERP